MQRQPSRPRAAATSDLLGMCPETLVLVGLCMADALSTILFVGLGIAVEYNPMMAWFLDRGPGLFLLAKVASFTPFVVTCELYRRRNSVRGRVTVRFAATVYALLYVVMLTAVNLRLI